MSNQQNRNQGPHRMKLRVLHVDQMRILRPRLGGSQRVEVVSDKEFDIQVTNVGVVLRADGVEDQWIPFSRCKNGVIAGE